MSWVEDQQGNTPARSPSWPPYEGLLLSNDSSLSRDTDYRFHFPCSKQLNFRFLSCLSPERECVVPDNTGMHVSRLKWLKNIVCCDIRNIFGGRIKDRCEQGEDKYQALPLTPPINKQTTNKPTQKPSEEIPCGQKKEGEKGEDG